MNINLHIIRRCLLWASFFLVFSNTCYSQNLEGNNWVLGNRSILSFDSLVPEVDTGNSLLTSVYPASMSSKKGDLLFYGGSGNFYNGFHQQVSSPLPINIYPQVALVTNIPGSQELIYIFSTSNSNLSKGKFFSIIYDPKLNSGLGGFVNGSFSQLPGRFHFLAFSLLDHSNGQDKWLFLVDSNHRANSFLISSTGIAASPVVSQDISVLHRSTQGFSFRIMKSSPNSRLISIGLGIDGDLGVFEFDRSTGRITNILFRDWKPVQGHYYVGFSPNSKLLYVTTKNLLLQYDLTRGSQSAIKNSEFVVDSVPGTVAWHYDLQLAPNGKIYQLTNGFTSYLNSINCPDIYGGGCNYQSSSVNMKRPFSGSFFPTLNQTLYVNTHKLQAQSQGDTTLCKGDTTELTAYGAAMDDFYWSPASSLSCTNCQSPIATPDTTTTYRVIGIARSCTQDNMDTAYVTVNVNPPKGKGKISGDSVLCGNQPTTLEGPEGFDNYWWLIGLPGRKRNISAPGTYQLRVESKCYVDTLTQTVTQGDTLEYTFPEDTTICPTDFPITLRASSNAPIYINGTQTNELTLNSASNTYFSTENFCGKAEKTVRVDTITLPQPLSDTALPDSIMVNKEINLPVKGYAVMDNDLRTFGPGKPLKYGIEAEVTLYQIRGVGNCTDTVSLKTIKIYKEEEEEVENVPCKLSVSPNPGADLFELTANQELQNIGVYDSRGQLMYGTDQPTETPFVFFSDGWSVGTYVIQATCKDTEVLRVKWIKR